MKYRIVKAFVWLCDLPTKAREWLAVEDKRRLYSGQAKRKPGPR